MDKLFAEGGVNTGNTEVDPISGNEVPPGSLPNEVRDDIDAKLSGGEYVVPADVLRYYGVSFFEKLRKKAKEGLSEMDADGRIGGGTLPEEEEDFPFSLEELEAEDEPAFAEGGMTAPQATGFNPTDYAFGGGSTGMGMGSTELKKYRDKGGNIVNVLFIDGKPVVDVKALGYTEWTEDTPVATGEAVKNPLEERFARSSDSSDTSRAGGPTGSSERRPVSPEENYYGLSAESLTRPEYSTFADSNFAGVGVKLGAALLGPGVALGAGAVKGFQEAQNLADARARQIVAKERRLDTSYLDALIKDMEKNASGVVKGLDLVGLDGTGIAGRHKKDFTGATTTPTGVTTGAVKTPATTPKRTSSSTSSSSDSWKPSSSDSGSGTASGTSRGVDSTRTGVTSTGAYSGSTATGSTAPTSSPRPQSRTTSTSTPASVASGSVSTQNPSYGTTGTARGGRARGGLVEKPTKKTTPKRKTKI
jgi:hypothetical protein